MLFFLQVNTVTGETKHFLFFFSFWNYDMASFLCLLVRLILMVFLFVSAPPKFTRTPVDQTGVSGGVASFICQATGDPRPKIVWNKKGKKVSNQRFEVLGPLFCSSEKHLIPAFLLIPICVIYYQWLSKIDMIVSHNLVEAFFF